MTLSCFVSFKVVDWVNCSVLSYTLMPGFSYLFKFVPYQWISSTFQLTVPSYKKTMPIAAPVCRVQFGMAYLAELEWQSKEAIQRTLNVNATGASRMIQTSLHLLRDSKGCIVLAGSVTS
ncbi:17-beta-hydroxysteroid dehydrogenase type 6-like [Tropilaelaps mercedesae]|uniref:17-beta-hydroxysteroid dehydrogenase type 6-like n=1 Tax=Tropilaelaps mercedesae TaxID=418985 RepID=A0A1V9XK00_9ACAR|nr:17-beta-hydroxysteroid dehydrogenase type 6-like [Tropilaelaps mercedesae]